MTEEERCERCEAFERRLLGEREKGLEATLLHEDGGQLWSPREPQAEAEVGVKEVGIKLETEQA